MLIQKAFNEKFNMNKKYLLIIFVATLAINKSYSQFKQLDIDKINFYNKKTTRIFVTALWCSPCVGKYKEITKIFDADTTFNNIVLFDASGFSVTKLSKIEENFYDSLKSFLIPYKYYGSKSNVVFNLPKKALKRLVYDLILKYPKHDNLDKFWFGDILIINPEGKLTMEKITL